MAKLTTKDRKNLPKSKFAIPSKAPGSGSYPIEDKAHARAALSRVSANGTPAEKAQVRAAVHERYPDMGKGGSKGGGHAMSMAAEKRETPRQERAESPTMEKREQRSGLEVAMHAQADKLHPVKGRGHG